VRGRTIAVLLALALLAAGCGSRLSDEQRLAATAGGGGGGIRAGATGDASGEEFGSGAGTTGDAGGGATAGAGGATGGGGGATAGSTGGGGGGAKPPAAPKKGNVCVTGTEIKIAVLTDLTGPVPGIFKPTVDAVNAWANLINSQGGIYGRKIKVIPIDSKTSTADNRAGAQQACKEAFAMVGSMSAYDDGGAGPINECGIPDISATVVNRPRDQAKTTYPAFPNVADYYILGPKKAIAEEDPNAVKNAAMLWLNAPVARFNAEKNMKAAESIGYNWVYKQQVEVVEPNYTRFVAEMKARNVQYVSMVGDDNSSSRLLKAFNSQNYIPKFREFDSAIYNPDFPGKVKDAGAAGEGTMVSNTSVPLEEAASNPEYKLYVSTLQRSGGKPNGFFGLYAWSAARLFQDSLEKIGPKITRQALIAHLQSVKSWDNKGMHAGHNIGDKRASPCFVMLHLQGGKFVRKFPAQGFDCNRHPLYKVY
jgi:ABC-type branched-subunit amino acid transport system substrate-binding protein